MKPSPPESLLPTGHAWFVVPAPGWRVVPESWVGRKLCRYDIGVDIIIGCRRPAVAVDTVNRNGSRLRMKDAKGYCAEHIGSHQWIADGQVLRWYAMGLVPA